MYVAFFLFIDVWRKHKHIHMAKMNKEILNADIYANEYILWILQIDLKVIDWKDWGFSNLPRCIWCYRIIWALKRTLIGYPWSPWKRRSDGAGLGKYILEAKLLYYKKNSNNNNYIDNATHDWISHSVNVPQRNLHRETLHISEVHKSGDIHLEPSKFVSRCTTNMKGNILRTQQKDISIYR